jgi:hypothetical protein
MKIMECKDLKDLIYDVFRTETNCYRDGNTFILNLPLYNLNMESLYMKFEITGDNNALITDDGESFGKLFMAGQNPYVKSNAIYERIEKILIQYGFEKEAKNLENQIEIKISNIFSEKGRKSLINFINVLQNIHGLSHLPPQFGKAAFNEDISNILKRAEISYEKNYALDKEITVDFFINSSRNMIIQAISNREKCFGTYWYLQLLRKKRKDKKYNKINLFDIRFGNEFIPVGIIEDLTELSDKILYYPKDISKFINIIKG